MQAEQPCDVNGLEDTLAYTNEVRWMALFRGFGTPWKRSHCSWLLVLSLLRPQIIAAMPLLSTLRARASAHNNLFSQYNIILTLLANSLFPIDEAPLSKFA